MVDQDGRCAVPGVYIVGDLTGVPLLKFSADSGARAVRAIRADPAFAKETAEKDEGVLDLVIIGAGVSGFAAALEAKAAGLRFELLEASEPLSTVVNFPKGKPIYTYPTEMVPAGRLRFHAQVKEALLDELRAQVDEAGIQVRIARAERIRKKGDVLAIDLAEGEPVHARRVIVAIGRSGNHRKLGVPGEDLPKVYNRLHDPADYRGMKVLVVGGGDSALEAAIALCQSGAEVTLSYRKSTFERPRPENIAAVHRLDAASTKRSTDACAADSSAEGVGRLRLLMPSQVQGIEPTRVVLRVGERIETIDNDVVFTLIGREAPLAFFRRSGIPIKGELRGRDKATMALFLAFCVFLYNWKAGGALKHSFETHGWFPFNVPAWFAGLGGAIARRAADPASLLGTAVISMAEPGFYYSLAYTLLVVIFGIGRIRRRATPYITRQTIALMLFQVIPLFVIPYFLLPWLGHRGAFDEGLARSFADAFFPEAGYGHGREYWRAFGFVLAWPLFIWNVFTSQPLWGWLMLSLVQTLIVIPALVYFFGKGAYCGWICSCGALAETLGDTQREKMPHGPFWNRLNMAGQVILAIAFLLLTARLIAWTFPETGVGRAAESFFSAALSGFSPFGIQLNYYWIVDVTLAGIIGVGLYFWYSGRVLCRFFCPLAALMHIYARFSRFRILAEKKKCISCNVCTSVCHQGIDVMGFANKGLPMADPECVRCSACVQSCPTGVLRFGQVDPKTGEVLAVDRMAASPVLMKEAREKRRS